MVSLEEAIKLISKCPDASDFQQLINACDLLIHSVEEIYVPLLIKYVETKLYRKALKVVWYKNTT